MAGSYSSACFSDDSALATIPRGFGARRSCVILINSFLPIEGGEVCFHR